MLANRRDTMRNLEAQPGEAPPDRATPAIVAYVCANAGRGGQEPTSGERPRPKLADVAWPVPVRAIPIPCAGRLQPEHLLKTFEIGTDAVCIIACEEDNCHSLEGSSRCGRRVEHVRQLLEQIGLGSDRLWLFRLPGSARDDMALGVEPFPKPPNPSRAAYYEARVERELRGIRQAISAKMAELMPNPLRGSRQ